jgi:hypothetical protein
MITVNKEAKQKKIDEAYSIALKTITDLANNGQEYFTIHMSLPNSNDGWEVFKRLEEQGVKVLERGFGSYKNSDGSCRFEVSCTVL